MIDDSCPKRFYSSPYRAVVLDQPHAIDALENASRNAHVVELGPGVWGGLARETLRFGADSYVGIDIDPRMPVFVHERARFHPRTDALSYLRELPTDSVVSVSTGFFDTLLLGSDGYLRELTQELSRVSRQGIHWIAPNDAAVLDSFERQGVALEPITAQLYRTQRIRSAL